MPTLILAIMKDIKAVYADASKEVASEFLDASGLAAERIASIQSQLDGATQAIAQAINSGVIAGVDQVTGLYGGINEKLLADLISGMVVTKDGIHNMVVGVNNRLILETINRMGQDGYTLSTRCWQIGADYQEQITRLITSGQAQGRSIADIARDIGDYTTGGVKTLPGGYTQAKYGDLVVKNVDWRALRLVRSEMGQSQQASALAQGKANPACLGLYDWVRINTQQHDCECSSLAAGSPYKEENVPGYPHPNCHPKGTLILTPIGARPIEDILPGDIVFDHKMNKSVVSASWKSIYKKQMYDIHTVHGEISCTDDHPILANGRWKSAKLLNPGDNLRYWPDNVVLGITANDNTNNIPPQMNEKISLYLIEESLLWGVMPITTVYLDGKLYVIKSKIDIELINSHINDGSFSEFFEGIKNLSLVLGLEYTLNRLGSSDKPFMVELCSPDCIVSGFSIIRMPMFMGPKESFTEPRGIISEFLKPFGYSVSVEPHYFCYLVNRSFLGIKQIQSTVNVKFNLPTHKNHLGYIDSHIVSVMSRKVNEQVYNLTIDGEHTFIANGFASHNCFCQVRPKLMSINDFEADLSRWESGESVPYLDDWYRSQYAQA